jgi:TP901 family phage tail tape measure protein
MSDFNVSLILKLVDRLSAPARRVVRQMGKIKQASSAGAKASRHWANDMQELETRLGKLGTASFAFNQMTQSGRAMTGVFVQPTKEAGAFQSRLADFGRIVGATDQQLQNIRKTVKAVSGDTAQSSRDILGAVEVLAGKGLDLDSSVAAAPALARAATATGAALDDLANAAFASIDNLGVEAGNLELAFDAMATAGKAGGFELRDQARWLPGLTAKYKALGIGGVSAVAELSAALQIARKGAGSADIAARNFENFLAKITAPDTVKRFEKFGVNLETEMVRAAELGISPIEHMLTLIEGLTDGDKFRIGELFGDMQVISFLDPMLQNMDEFRSIRAEALAGQGTIGKDFDSAMRDWNRSAALASNAVDELSRAVGRNLLPKIQPLVKMGAGFANFLTNIIDRFPVLGTIVATLVGGFGLLLFTVGALGNAVVSIAGTWMIATTVLGKSNLTIGATTLRLRALAGAAMMSGRAMMVGALRGAMALGRGLFLLALRGIPAAIMGMRALTIAVMSNPIGLIIGGIAIAAALIIANWGKIGPFFGRVFGWIINAIAPVWKVIKTVLGFTPLGLIVRAWKPAVSWLIGLVKTPGAAVQSAWGFIKKVFSWSPLGLIIRAWNPIQSFFKSLFGGIQSLAEAVFSKIMAVIGAPAKLIAKTIGLGAKALGLGSAAAALTLVTSPAGADEPPFIPPPPPSNPPASPPIPLSQTPLEPAVQPAPGQLRAGTTVLQDVKMTIHATPGQDVKQLARQITRELREENRKSLHDG